MLGAKLHLKVGANGEWQLGIAQMFGHITNIANYLFGLLGGGVWSAGPSDLTEALCEISAAEIEFSK